MIDARFVSVEKWPGEKRKAWNRKSGTFRAKYSATLDLLESELKHLRAKNIVIEAYFGRDKIRNDGWPFSKAAPTEPGVIVSFTGKSGELSFPCDTYRDWEDNLRAIALALEALRAVDRYGVTQHAEQYKGWAKLPPAPERMQSRAALEFVALHSEIRPTDADSFTKAYRSAARKLHPDNPQTGNSGQFILLQQAKKAVSLELGW